MKIEQDKAYEPVVITLENASEARALRSLVDFHDGNVGIPPDIDDLLRKLSDAFGYIFIPE